MRNPKSLFLLLAGLVVLLVTYVIASHSMVSKIADDPVAPPTKRAEFRISQVRDEVRFNDVAILDNTRAWAIGWDGRDPGRVWYSGDGGRSWEVRTWPQQGYFYDRSIYFIDQQQGWAVGNGNLIIHTTDGGMTWEEAKVPTEGSLHIVHFANPQVGYVAASVGVRDRETDTITNGIEILCTTDGGKNWRTCYRDNQSVEVFEIVAPSENIAIASLDGGSLLRTEDGGLTWRVVAFGSREFHSVVFNTDGVGWAVGRGSFYRSLDQGKTWQRFENLPQEFSNRYWTSIDFADTQRGMAVGDNGAIAITTDGGKTWIEYTSDIKESLAKIRLRNKSGIILGSKKVYSIDFNALS